MASICHLNKLSRCLDRPTIANSHGTFWSFPSDSLHPVELVRGVGAAIARLGAPILEALNGWWVDSRAGLGGGFA